MPIISKNGQGEKGGQKGIKPAKQRTGEYGDVRLSLALSYRLQNPAANFPRAHPRDRKMNPLFVDKETRRDTIPISNASGLLV